MNRLDFLKSLGLGAAAIVFVNELQSCKKNTPPTPTVDFTVDMGTATYSSLLNPNTAVITNGVIIAHTPTGTYIAVSVSCTHRGCDVNYTGTTNKFLCPCHGASFDSTGAVLNGPATTPLTKYTVSQSGNVLHITA